MSHKSFKSPSICEYLSCENKQIRYDMLIRALEVLFGGSTFLWTEPRYLFPPISSLNAKLS